MFRVLKAIFAKTVRESLPKLENTLTAKYNPLDIGEEEYLILMAGVAKDPEEARRLMRTYNASTAFELFKVLPKRKVNWRRRLRLYTQSLEGSMNSDPYKQLLWPDGSGTNYLN